MLNRDWKRASWRARDWALRVSMTNHWRGQQISVRFLYVFRCDPSVYAGSQPSSASRSRSQGSLMNSRGYMRKRVAPFQFSHRISHRISDLSTFTAQQEQFYGIDSQKRAQLWSAYQNRRLEQMQNACNPSAVPSLGAMRWNWVVWNAQAHKSPRCFSNSVPSSNSLKYWVTSGP